SGCLRRNIIEILHNGLTGSSFHRFNLLQVDFVEESAHHGFTIVGVLPGAGAFIGDYLNISARLHQHDQVMVVGIGNGKLSNTAWPLISSRPLNSGEESTVIFCSLL